MGCFAFICLMDKLNFPNYKFNIKKSDEDLLIFDEVRKKYIVLTPEEWVRQHLVFYLAQEKKFPQSCMKLEMQLKINTLQRRPDIVVYNNSGNPIFIAECKAPNIKITQDVFEQIAQYNLILKVPYLMVSNGLNHYYCKVNFETKSITFIEDLPNYHDLQKNIS
jgi:hypothetical protein